MDIQFYGANCLTIGNKHTRLVVDDNLAELGAKPVTRQGDICLFTSAHGEVKGAKITIAMPGEYEVGGVSVYGIQARAHMDEERQRSAIMYKLVVGDTRILVTGHVFPKFSDIKLETIGMVDVMCVPVGGNGYTLDATGALQLVRQVEPKIVILTHYADKDLTFPVPQQSLEDALKTFGMEPKDTAKKFQYKPGDVTDVTQLIVLEKS